jgi:hypothetical protein
MRAFYAAALGRLLEHCAVGAAVEVSSDRPGAWCLAITVTPVT